MHISDNVPSWRCHPEAIQYHDNYKTLREKLARRLFNEFNKAIFGSAMDADLPILWDSKLRSTAGYVYILFMLFSRLFRLG